MLERPKIADPEIEAILKKEYGIDNARIEFLPLGNDVNTAVYSIGSSDERLYLKLRKSNFNPASVMVPYLLNRHGTTQVIAPMPTQDQQEWVTLHDYSLSLYPFIEGRNGFQQPLSSKQWVEFGSAVKGLHALSVPNDLAARIPREGFSPVHRSAVRKSMQQIEGGNYPDEIARQMADFLKFHAQQIAHLIERAEELGEKLQKQQPDFVLCHGDLHARNILIDLNDKLHLIDWDTLIFAPKERDLMFIGGGIGGAWNRREEEEQFYQGYGATQVNSDALNYYRYERIIEDIEEFSKRLLLTGDGGKDRERSLNKFIDAFSPNNVVEIAQREAFFEPKIGG